MIKIAVCQLRTETDRAQTMEKAKRIAQMDKGE